MRQQSRCRRRRGMGRDERRRDGSSGRRRRGPTRAERRRSSPSRSARADRFGGGAARAATSDYGASPAAAPGPTKSKDGRGSGTGQAAISQPGPASRAPPNGTARRDHGRGRRSGHQWQGSEADAYEERGLRDGGGTPSWPEERRERSYNARVVCRWEPVLRALGEGPAVRCRVAGRACLL